jgi:hypothetical protein
MNKIKDFLYDKNDVLVALIIVGLAIFVIFTRFEAIMAYPEQMMATQPPRDVTSSNIAHQTPPAQADPEYNPYENGYDNGDEYGYGNNYGYENGNADPSGNREVTGAFSLYIVPNQPMSIIARDLVSLGFFENEQDFINTLELHDATRSVRAGNFIIPRNSTREEIIRIITSNPTG